MMSSLSLDTGIQGRVLAFIHRVRGNGLDNIQAVKRDPATFFRDTFGETGYSLSPTEMGLDLELPLGGTFSLLNRDPNIRLTHDSAGRGHKRADLIIVNDAAGRSCWIDAKNFLSEKTGEIDRSWLDEKLVSRYIQAKPTTRKVVVCTPVFERRLTSEGRTHLLSNNIQRYILPCAITPSILERPHLLQLMVERLIEIAKDILNWLSGTDQHTYDDSRVKETCSVHEYHQQDITGKSMVSHLHLVGCYQDTKAGHGYNSTSNISKKISRHEVQFNLQALRHFILSETAGAHALHNNTCRGQFP